MFAKTVTVLAVLSLGLAACSSTPSTEEAADSLCSSLETLETSVAQIAALGPDSTVDDAEASRDALVDAWNDVKDDAEVVNEAAADEANNAVDQFNDAISDVSGDSSLGEAAAQAVSATQAFGAALDEIENSISCE
jgi:prephenate dehydrogenase